MYLKMFSWRELIEGHTYLNKERGGLFKSG